MNFISTRDPSQTKYSAASVIKKGLADDGGLFVPEFIPQVTLSEIESYCNLEYPDLAARILGKFLSDYSQDELLADCTEAYSKKSFSEDVCPIKKIDSNTYSLELWYGPTCAFKDMALQIMPRLLSRALKKTGETRTALILVATSGDTGKAALEGYKNIDQIKISVFYPKDGVSTMQELQMATQDGINVNVCAVNGNFDDIQTAVKHIFASDEIASDLNKKGYFLSSANSINFGRLAPQIVYYFKAYCDLLKQDVIALGDKVNVCVPTGNFGNILAAYIAKLMGLPLETLICASNSNNILTDFLNTGRYDRNRDFHLTISPSMDILISSNLERLLYFISGSESTSSWMYSLNQNGYYEADLDTMNEISKSFKGYCADEEQTKNTIKKYFYDYNYLMDTHTAVAFSALDQYREKTNDSTPCIVASTANPYKFAKDVYNSLTGLDSKQGFSSLYALYNETLCPIPEALLKLSDKRINFNTTCNKNSMIDEVFKFISK